jgi:RNAse (barnase) inhibitor barstar
MKEIRLDAAKWKTRDDFYDALLSALGAPAWHGHNLDALKDSIGSDQINEVHLPFCFLIVGTDRLPVELRSCLKMFAKLVADLPMLERAGVKLICEPPL